MTRTGTSPGARAPQANSNQKSADGQQARGNGRGGQGRGRRGPAKGEQQQQQPAAATPVVVKDVTDGVIPADLPAAAAKALAEPLVPAAAAVVEPVAEPVVVLTPAQLAEKALNEEVEAILATVLSDVKTPTADRKAATAPVVAFLLAEGLKSPKTALLLRMLTHAANNDEVIGAREGAFLVIEAICATQDRAWQPTVAPWLSVALTRAGEKKSNEVRNAGRNAAKAIVLWLGPNALPFCVPHLIAGVNDYSFHTKQASLYLLQQLSTLAPVQLATCVPVIVPGLKDAIFDTKGVIAKGALKSMTAAFAVIGNADIERFIPTLLSCITNPQEIEECIHKLSATTFIQTVTAPTLSVLVPVLERALRTGSTAIKRKAAVIADNMAKLVDDPVDAHVFLPILRPLIERAADELADPEARMKASQSLATFVRIQEAKASSEESQLTPQALDKKFGSLVQAEVGSKLSVAGRTALDAALLHCGAIASVLCTLKAFEVKTWKIELCDFLAPFLTADVVETTVKTVLKHAAARYGLEHQTSLVIEDDDDDDGSEDLCNCVFSLAYGSKILLNACQLWLKRGRRYGLVGPNGSGKSTLMRAIARGELDGFPPQDQLKTVYVEADIAPDAAELSVVKYVFEDAMADKHMKADMAQVVEVLTSVGFTDAMQADPVTSLSGGWRMKLALARAMLKNADILLLDEPTNHLDVKNVLWVEDYLKGQDRVTSIIVSHDAKFLDNVCTDIIHCADLKLKTFRGNLSAFVEKVPSAKAYHELKKSSVMEFKFPDPAFLEGVNSRGKVILRMTDVGFTYPGTTRKILHGVSIYCSMSSRCAVVGPNGAGKSTMIKLLTGEIAPDTGTVFRHPNSRIAYVAQHAFHHIEKHLSKTANQYIRWRFDQGEDKEAIVKVDRIVTEEDIVKQNTPQAVPGYPKKAIIERICSRRVKRGVREYELKLKGKLPEDNLFMERRKLDQWGWRAVINTMDAKEAAKGAGGAAAVPLTSTNVEKHLACLGLDAEFATHYRMDALSTSQKVKVVLAAATWDRAQIIVLDEPTNYLDREALGALADAIRKFEGGVVIISHHREFTDALCTEQWSMAAGVLTPSGQPDDNGKGAEITSVAADETTDRYGNTIKIVKKKKLTKRQKMQKAKAKKEAEARGEYWSDSDDEE